MINEPVTVPVEFLNAFRSLAVSSENDYKQHIRETVIFPMIERWGFESRFHCDRTSPETGLECVGKQKAMLDKVRGLLRGRGAIIALIGPRGLGKTTIASQLAIDEAWRNYRSTIRESGPPHHRHVIYRKAAKLISRYKSLFADFGSTETEALLESLDYLCRHQELLVIDELHDCDDQKMKLRVLTDLIDRRYSCQRDTVLIANQTAQDFAASVGDSILSRLNEHGAILECFWKSWRC